MEALTKVSKALDKVIQFFEGKTGPYAETFTVRDGALAYAPFEEGRVAVRNVRRDANDELAKAEKAKTISEDDLHRWQKEIQKIIDELSTEVDTLLAELEDGEITRCKATMANPKTITR